MNNLLLFEDRQRIVAEYRRRRLIVILSFVLVIVGSAIALMLGVYGNILIALRARETTAKTEGQSIALTEYRTMRREMSVARAALAALPPPGTAAPSDVFRDILNARPAGISVTALSYARPEPNRLTVVVEGTAASRKALVAFTEVLKADKQFSSVASPLSNLIRDINSRFAITLTLVEPAKQ